MQVGWRVEAHVEQMSGSDVAKGLEHRLFDARMLTLQVHEETLDALPLQAEVSARRTAAADNRQPTRLGIRTCFLFPDVNERPYHHMCAVVGT